MLERDKAIAEVGRLRNRHVAKLLTYLGDTPEYLQAAIKRAFSMFVEDVEDNIIDGNAQSQDAQHTHDHTHTQHEHEGQGDDHGNG